MVRTRVIGASRGLAIGLLGFVIAACGRESDRVESIASTEKAASAGDAAGDGHGHGAGSDGGEGAHSNEEGEPDFARIDPARAPQLGLVLATAGPQEVAETTTLTGRLVIDPKKVAAVRARFPGPVVRVHKDVGEAVRAGESLADVESNESLTVYEVRSPLRGVVLERLTNVGDVAGSEPLYRVGDLRALQAELKAFPAQRAAVRLGARARIRLGDREVAGHVVAVAPQVEGDTQAVNVRIAFDAPNELPLVPGQFVTGAVERGRASAAIAVRMDAIQRLEGREVVFVPEADGFRARPITLGRRGANYAEVTAGLAPGTRYVAKGAFLLKADIGKNEAEHEH
jgi:cobalt-zinc-cadmium efflux system membrane fusion protein